MIALIAPNTKPPTVTSTIKITTKRVSFSNPVFFRCPLSPKATHVTSFTEYIVKSILTRNVLFRKLQTVSLNISLLNQYIFIKSLPYFLVLYKSL